MLEIVRRWPPAAVCRVAFSGGLDSTVLLHALAALRGQMDSRLIAVHINHGLQAKAAEWDRHCRIACDGWGIEYQAFELNARPVPRRSPEDRSRELRYAALKGAMQAGDILVTAHHQDDQAETLLLQLCRGSGPAGLAAMPALRRFGPGFHARPLLRWKRSELADYAAAHGLGWVDDPSNVDPAFDRNFVRAQVLGELRARWPGIGTTLGRVATLQAEAREILHEIALSDLSLCTGLAPHRLSLDALRTLSAPRQMNLMHHWLATLSLPMPARTHLEVVRRQMLDARPDARAVVRWPGAEVRRFAGELWALAPPAPRDARDRFSWHLREPSDIAHGSLDAKLVRGHGLRRDGLDDDHVEIRFRHGGETIQPAGDRHHRELKKLLQQARIPPWLRDRLPLLYAHGRLVAVANLWVDAAAAAPAAERGWEILWHDHAAGAGV